MVSLTGIVRDIKQTAVSVPFVRDRLPPKCRIVEYTSLRGKHRATVFKGTEALVVRIPKKGSSLGHFICLIPGRKSIEYFSSLGNSPWKELEALHESRDIFENLLGKNFNYNQRQLQDGSNYSINDCAVWVLLRAYFRKYKLREFQKLFNTRVVLGDPDTLAATMVVALWQDR